MENTNCSTLSSELPYEENRPLAFSGRRPGGRPCPAMTAPERGALILDAWRADVTRRCGEKGPAHGVVDPTGQDLDSALERLKDEGLKAMSEGH